MQTEVRIVLIDPVSPEGYNCEGEVYKPSAPNLGLICLATFISTRYDANVEIIDMGVSGYDYHDVLNLIKNTKPNLVGLTSKTFNIVGAYRLAEMVKSFSKDITVLVGGDHCTALPERTLEECEHIDAVVRGEGELTLGEIVERLSLGFRDRYKLFKDVSGVTFRGSDGSPKAEQDREFISDLSQLPTPDFSFVNIGEYAKSRNPVTGKLQHRFPVFYCRGCPFKCSYCMSPGKYRMKSPMGVAKEIEVLHKDWGAEFVMLHGSGLYAFERSPLDPAKKWYEEFCELYIEKGLHTVVQWGFETRVDASDFNMFKKVKEAGCIQIGFGIESGNELILAKTGKKWTKAQIIQTVRHAKEARIPYVRANFILGLPYETADTAKETLDLMMSLPIDGVGVGILDVYPGTDVFEMAEKGKAGLRWLPGKRMNWESYSRSEVQVVVNDLTEQALIELREEAIERWRASKITGEVGEGTEQLIALVKHYRSRLKEVAKNRDIYKKRLNDIQERMREVTKERDYYKERLGKGREHPQD